MKGVLQMNYFSLLQEFRNKRRGCQLGKDATLLYFIIWEYVNQYSLQISGFTAANSALIASSGLNRNNLRTARNELVENGIITYKSGGSKKSGTYSLVTGEAPNKTSNETSAEASNEASVEARDEASNGALFVHYNNTYTKQDKDKRESKRTHGLYKRVLLSEKEYQGLADEFGKDEVERCIAYVDEYVQSNGNKNGYKDWNLVIGKAVREKWGRDKPAYPQKQRNKFNNFTSRESNFVEIERKERDLLLARNNDLFP